MAGTFAYGEGTGEGLTPLVEYEWLSNGSFGKLFAIEVLKELNDFIALPFGER